MALDADAALPLKWEVSFLLVQAASRPRLLRYRVAHRSAAARPGLTQVLEPYMSFQDLPVRANLFDASALVKVFSDEYDSALIQTFFNQHAPTRYTTPFASTRP
jgi:hypothetical protein